MTFSLQITWRGKATGGKQSFTFSRDCNELKFEIAFEDWKIWPPFFQFEGKTKVRIDYVILMLLFSLKPKLEGIWQHILNRAGDRNSNLSMNNLWSSSWDMKTACWISFFLWLGYVDSPLLSMLWWWIIPRKALSNGAMPFDLFLLFYTEKF